ncbi:hypothetical protein CEF21_08420 [Bacillus sp. FJAT-42376]|nr:hypothetical protein CEF21_08420 [Bacillus sp. FJAT-42376]
MPDIARKKVRSRTTIPDIAGKRCDPGQECRTSHERGVIPDKNAGHRMERIAIPDNNAGHRTKKVRSRTSIPDIAKKKDVRSRTPPLKKGQSP